MTKRNIIFLDVDGVLNNEIWFRAMNAKYTRAEFGKMDFNLANIDIDSIVMLNDLCKEVNASVVISSAWRIGRTLEELQTLFISLGATFEIIGVTPTSEGARGVEIRKYISDNKNTISNYVIIDDETCDMLVYQLPHIFKCDPFCGLSPSICYKVKRFFNNEL